MVEPKKKRLRAAQMDPETRRIQLLQLGVSAFASKGIDSAKHADIARASGVSVPTVFSYFPNREALVEAILDEVARGIVAEVLEPAQQLSDTQARLEATAPLYIQFAEKKPDYVKVWLMWSMHFAHELQVKYALVEEQIIGYLRGMILELSLGRRADDSAEDLARMILACSNVLAKMVLDGVPEARRERFYRHVLQPLTTMVQADD